jgi:hypothetical protein
MIIGAQESLLLQAELQLNSNELVCNADATVATHPHNAKVARLRWKLQVVRVTPGGPVSISDNAGYAWFDLGKYRKALV